MNQKDQFVPGQYVRVRDNEHQPWQVRIFHSFDTHRPGSWDSKQYARVMLKDGFQFNKDAATECFMMIEPWVLYNDQYQWVWVLENNIWRAAECSSAVHRLFSFGGDVAPLTLPPFIAPGDKY